MNTTTLTTPTNEQEMVNWIQLDGFVFAMYEVAITKSYYQYPIAIASSLPGLADAQRIVYARFAWDGEIPPGEPAIDKLKVIVNGEFGDQLRDELRAVEGPVDKIDGIVDAFNDMLWMWLDSTISRSEVEEIVQRMELLGVEDIESLR